RPDPRHQPARRRRPVIAALGGERHELEERRVGVEETRDPLAHEQPAARRVPLARLRRSPLPRGLETGAQVGRERAVVTRILLELRVATEVRGEAPHYPSPSGGVAASTASGTSSASVRSPCARVLP